MKKINFEDNDVRQFSPRSLLQWLAKCIKKQDDYIVANAVKGDKGDKGDTVVSVQIGNTTTGEAGTNANVTNVGTDTEAILDFTIPKGDKGDKGDKGATGERGEKGEQGLAASIAIGNVTSVDNSQPAKVTNSGTAQNAILDFEIPKGDKGDTGATGERGEQGLAASIAIGSVTTVDSSKLAKVTNSGTPQNAILDFEIPKGENGKSGNYEWIDGRSATAEQKAASILIKVNCKGQFTYDGTVYTVGIGGYVNFKIGAQTTITELAYAYNDDSEFKALFNISAHFAFNLMSSGEIQIVNSICILLDKNAERVTIENPTITLGDMLTIV